MTELRVETLVIPGSRIGAENPLPIFRDKNIDQAVPLRPSIPDEKRKYFGWQAGRRVLPYRMQDNYNRNLSPYSMKVVVLENEILKATFWVELGGRLMSLIYKPLNRELLYNNPVFQPANLALRNAWFAGGIEWNMGHYGHSFLTCTPVFAAAIQGEQGDPGLRLYDFDRCKGLLWQTDFSLPPNSHFLIAFTRVVNPQDEDTSLYWWTNIAVPEQEGLRILSPTDQAIYIDQQLTGFGYADISDLPSLPSKDPTYSLNWPNANEFFFQCDQADIPWEAALDKDGCGLIEASTRRLKYRKLFCWGTHQGGRHWQEYLALPGMAYLEIQAGLAPTQLHHLPFRAQEEWYWTEFFGCMQADPVRVHDPNYHEAWQFVDGVLKTRLTAVEMAEVEQTCRKRADIPSRIILQEGTGWGALEIARREHEGGLDSIPSAFVFPMSTLGKEQIRWLPLLAGDPLAPQEPGKEPGEWLVQKEWRSRMEKSLEKPRGRSWYALLHYGVMLAEAFDTHGARAAWEESIAQVPSAWAYRNLAALAQTEGDLEEAQRLYAEAWRLALEHRLWLEPFAHERLSLLVLAEKYAPAWDLYLNLPAHEADSDRIQILRAMIALKLGYLDEVAQVLKRDFATVREGQVDLTNLWYEMWRQRMAVAGGINPQEISEAEVKAAHPVPSEIDFRSVE